MQQLLKPIYYFKMQKYLHTMTLLPQTISLYQLLREKICVKEIKAWRTRESLTNQDHIGCKILQHLQQHDQVKEIISKKIFATFIYRNH